MPDQNWWAARWQEQHEAFMAYLADPPPCDGFAFRLMLPVEGDLDDKLGDALDDPRPPDPGVPVVPPRTNGATADDRPNPGAPGTRRPGAD